MTILRAYHGDPAVKTEYIARIRSHRAADELIRGTGWDGHRGCAVGCTLDSYEHARYETELGIPLALAHLEDRIFEGLPLAVSMEWPERFLEAAPVGADLSRVQWQFLHWLLTDSGLLDDGGREDVRAAIAGSAAVIEPATRGGPIVDSARSAAWSAESAAESARSAAWSAESAAESARIAAWSAESAAWSAAESAAWSAAESAAESARSAAWSAAWSAAESAESAESAAFELMADKLAELMAASPVGA